jgi:hypothetical protein
VVDLLVGIVLLAVMLGPLGALGMAITWRLVRRHPLADLLIGGWLLRRHERRRNAVDARSWPRVQQPDQARSCERGAATPRWTGDKKEQVRANMRRLIQRLPIKYLYPPDQQESAIILVMEQAEALAEEFAAREG